jgi:glycyl-tRNA synthetase
MKKEEVFDVLKRRGIVYPSFELYGGLSGFYDYGPIGSRVKQNIEDLIREYYVIGENCLEVECPTISPEQVWVASGHVKNFADMLTECQKCGEPYRADHIVESELKIDCAGKQMNELYEIIQKNNIRCPKCKGELGKVYNYNLMFKTEVGNPGKIAYLRPETAQTTYLAFRRLWDVARKKLPFGVLQIGHSYRNEISPRQGMIRLREFNQAELQYFVDPDNKRAENFSEVAGIQAKVITKDDKEITLTLKEACEKGIIKIELIAYFLGRALQMFEEMGLPKENLRLRQHKDDERAFYSSDTWDVEYMSANYGKIEILGISDRTDYDLTAHMKLSGEDMSVMFNEKKFVPHVIEVAHGIDRPVYCVLESCYVEEGERAYFKLPKKIAPYLVSVLPLVNKDNVPEKAQEVFNLLRKKRVYVLHDRSGSIGRRYARADEIGVPYCVTIDYDTLKDDTVTIRERDSKQQKRIRIDEIYKEITA